MGDLARGQGYVHAQDRFFEMDVRRHATAGRLAELFGEDAVESDAYVRTMGWRRVAEKEVALLTPDTRAFLEAYADGVNAYLDDRGTSTISVEYTVLGLGGLDYQPEDWTPVDSLAWLKAMAWDLRGNMGDEIERVLSADAVGAERTAQLFPAYPYDEVTPIVTQGAVVDQVYEQDAERGQTRLPLRPGFEADQHDALRDLRDGLERMPAWLGRGEGIGSNSWVVVRRADRVGRARCWPTTRTWAPACRACGPRWACTAATSGRACPLDVSGFTFSGVPGVIIGHNADVAWGFTNLGPDVGRPLRRAGQRRGRAARRRAAPAADPRGGDPGPGRAGRAHHGAHRQPRPAGLRRRRADRRGRRRRLRQARHDRARGRRGRRRAAVDRAAAGHHRRRDPGAQPGHRLGLLPGRGRRLRGARPEPRLRRHRRATSATRRPGGSRSASPATTARCPRPAGCPRTTGPAASCRTTPCPACSTPTRGSWSPPTRPWSARTTPTSSPTTGTAARARERIRDLLTQRFEAGPVDADDMLEVQLDTRNPMAPVLVPYLLDVPLDRGYADDGQELLRRLGLQPARRGRALRRGGVLQRGVGQPAAPASSTTSCPPTSPPTAGSAGWPWSPTCSTSPTTRGGTTW